MKYFIIFVALFSIHSVFAESKLPFNDRGVTYNPLEYVRTIDTGDGTYTIEFKNEEESYFTNFIVTSQGVVAFDPLSDIAAKVYAEVIKERAPGLPLLAIIYSHLHTDHISGARVLRHILGKDTPIIAHERVLHYFNKFKTPYIDLPTETVSNDGGVYKFGDRTIDLRYMGDAHTSSILVGVILELRMAYVCDYANNDVVGWTTFPGINLDDLMEMQRRTLELDVDKITFCHGPPGDMNSVKRQVEYHETLLAEATKAYKKGLSEDEAVESITLPQYKHFYQYDNWFTGNVRAMYRWAKSKSSE